LHPHHRQCCTPCQYWCASSDVKPQRQSTVQCALRQDPLDS